MPATLNETPESRRPPLVDKKALLLLYQQKRFDSLAEWMLQICMHFDTVHYTELSIEDRLRVDDIASMFMFLLTQEDFLLPDRFLSIFCNIGHLIANIFCISSYGSTDSLVAHLGRQKQNLVKILSTYTVLNKPIIPMDVLFNASPPLASIWWLNYQTSAAGSTTAELHERITKQFTNLPPKYTMCDFRVAPLYFNCSYYTYNGEDRQVKEMLNAGVRAIANVHTVRNTPNPRSVAILTGKWQPNTAVYKSMSPYLKDLAENFDLTLVHYGKHVEFMELKSFKKVCEVKAIKDRSGCDVSSIINNDFAFAYFMDVGMCEESVYLANMRIAPIMATGYGHPVSTFGSNVDYFFGGVECERADLAVENYSERLVLLPGLGAHPVYPNYKRTNPSKEQFIINCPWTTSKINWPMLEVLRNVIARAKREVCILFCPSWTMNRYNATIQFITNLRAIFGKNFKVLYDKPYHEYLAELEKGSLALDSFPFGGYNTIVDSFFVGVPVVSIEGTRFYNRASSALLRKVGLGSLITDSLQTCEDKLVELVNTPELLAEMRKPLESDERLQELLIHTPEPASFTRAIKHLIANHENLKGGTSPIYIQ